MHDALPRGRTSSPWMNNNYWRQTARKCPLLLHFPTADRHRVLHSHEHRDARTECLLVGSKSHSVTKGNNNDWIRLSSSMLPPIPQGWVAASFHRIFPSLDVAAFRRIDWSSPLYRYHQFESPYKHHINRWHKQWCRRNSSDVGTG